MGSIASTMEETSEQSTRSGGEQAARRHRRATEGEASAYDDPWWWEIENQDLILNQTTVNESNAGGMTRADGELMLSEDFNTLLKIGENVNLTLTGNNNNNNANSNVASEQRIEMKIATTTTTTEDASAACDSENVRSENESASASARTDYSLIAVSNSDTGKASTPAPTSAPAREQEQSLEEFKEELRVKRLARQTAVQDLRDEITSLRKQLACEQALTRRLRSTDDDEQDDAANAALTATDSNAADLVDAASSDAATGMALGACLVDADDVDPMSRGRHANIELANAQMELQLANAENLSLRTELGVVQKQVGTLKEVVACCKQMLTMKEEQCTQLKSKLQEIENSFGEYELKTMSAKLREEYERQLGNIQQLRQLYEERQRISAAEQENLQRLILIKRDELAAEQEKTKNFEERNHALLKEVENANNELAALREECNEHKFEKKALKEEMGAVNTLFSQMVMGFNGKNNLDIDRLTTMLEENRALLNDMATKEINCSDGATLPKLLFELVEQAAVSSKRASRSPTPLIFTETETEDDDEEHKQQINTESTAETSTISSAAASATDEPSNHAATAETTVAANEDTLDAVKEQSIELAELGATACSSDSTAPDNAAKASTTRNARKHQRKVGSNKIKLYACVPTLTLHETDVIGKVASAQEIIGNLPKVWKVLMELLSHHRIEQVQFEENGTGEDCYKSVETANGPKAELSVSKTYIKLKDLILEKKALVKETNRLKTLNCHLDYRLNEQEKRLSAVSLELTKTWHLVGKMQRQHRQLHTQEQILRYQLQQKRRLLTELKDELEYCRRKWAAARAKNDESQEQCNDLRREFAKRKLEDANNSAESGYSDSGPASDEEERVALAAEEERCAATVISAAAAATATCASGSSNTSSCRRKYLKEMFEHTRKIKRMQSTSPGRAARAMWSNEGAAESAEIVLRWNSAPPTCGWRDSGGHGGGGGGGAAGYEADYDETEAVVELAEAEAVADANKGAIPKGVEHSSRSKQRGRQVLDAMQQAEQRSVAGEPGSTEQRADRADRIQRLEQQCKSLIQQVLETSDNRERLEVQLCRFQDNIAPVQYAVPLDEFINKRRIERMTRASSAPASGTLTPREEEYTRKRSERLERLEEESRQLMSRIKRTSDRGHYLRCSLDRIRRAPSREGSFESNAEEEASSSKAVEEVVRPTTISEGIATDAPQPAELEATTEDSTSTETHTKSALTTEEEEYTARRAARLQRLEEEGKQLITKLTQNAERGSSLDGKLDDLHARYGANETTTAPAATPPPASIEQRIENIERISTNREERLRLLEEEGKQLLTRLTHTSERGTRMINRIAERELNRQARLSATPSRDEGDDASKAEAPEAAALLPPLKNVACSSIVGEELTERATVTTTPSQIAALLGAIPKSKPVAQLSAARPKPSKSAARQTNDDGESLEDMVKRLKQLPFPEQQAQRDAVLQHVEDVPQAETPKTETAEHAVECEDETKDETT